MAHTSVRARPAPAVAWCRPNDLAWSRSLCQSRGQEPSQPGDVLERLRMVDDQRRQVHLPTDRAEQAFLETGREVEIVERVHRRALRQQLGVIGDLEPLVNRLFLIDLLEAFENQRAEV